MSGSDHGARGGVAVEKRPSDEIACASADGATRLRVLIVDDEPERVAILREGLAGAGVDRVAVTSTREDLLACVGNEAPHVVIVDIAAPTRDMLEDFAALARGEDRWRSA